MNENNHTGTLFSFRNPSDDWYYSTSDLTHLREIVVSDFISVGAEVLIENNTYTIQNMSAQVLAGVCDDFSVAQHGEENPYSVQLFITIDHP